MMRVCFAGCIPLELAFTEAFQYDFAMHRTFRHHDRRYQHSSEYRYNHPTITALMALSANSPHQAAEFAQKKKKKVE
jgi:hypothetical protein